MESYVFVAIADDTIYLYRIAVEKNSINWCIITSHQLIFPYLKYTWHQRNAYTCTNFISTNSIDNTKNKQSSNKNKFYQWITKTHMATIRHIATESSTLYPLMQLIPTIILTTNRRPHNGAAYETITTISAAHCRNRNKNESGSGSGTKNKGRDRTAVRDYTSVRTVHNPSTVWLSRASMLLCSQTLP